MFTFELKQTVIRDMSQEEYDKHVGALATKRMEKTKKINEQNMKYWSEIISNTYNFDRGESFLQISIKERTIIIFPFFLALHENVRAL